MMHRDRAVVWAALSAGLLFAACEPNSLTEAREQLGRTPNDTIEYRIPIVQDTFFVGSFLPDDTVTTASGTLGLVTQTDSLDFDFTDVLQTVSSSVTINFPSARDTLRFTTPDGSAVLSAVPSSGFFVRSFSNATVCNATTMMTVVDSLGATVVTLADLPVASGATVTDSINLTGISFSGFVDVTTTADFGVCSVGVGTFSTTVTVRDLGLQSVTLDNLNETFDVEIAQELDSADASFGELDDFIQDVTLNDATVNLAVTNTADFPVSLQNFFLGAVQIDPVTGQLKRDAGSNLDFELDSLGNVLKVDIVDPGLTTFDLQRSGAKTVALQIAPLADRIAKSLAAGTRIAFVATGTVASNDGSQGTVQATDLIQIGYEVVVGLDLTIPLTGVSLELNQVSDGLDLDSTDVTQLTERLVSASGTATVENFTAFGVEVVAGLASGALPDNADVFAQPDAVVLDTINVAAPNVSPTTGLPLGTASASVSVTLTGDEAKVMFGPDFTAGLRLRLMPGAGGAGRGVIRSSHQVAVSAQAVIRVRRGSP